MSGHAIRDSTTLPSRQWCTTAGKKKWTAFRRKVLDRPFGDAFVQTLVVLVSSLISPETGVFCREADIDGFFEPEYLFPDERMFLLQFVYRVARDEPISSTELVFHNIPRDVWLAFLLPILSDSQKVTAFYFGTTPATKIKLALEQLGLAASAEKIYTLQHRLGPILGSEVIVPFKAPLPVSIPEIGEVFAKASDLQGIIGSVNIPQECLIVLAMSHFVGLRQLFIQEWSETFHAEQVSSIAIQQFWVVATPSHGLALLLAVLVRQYYVFGKVATHNALPQVPEDLSPRSFFLLTEATASYARVFGVESLLHQLFPKFKYLRAVLSPSRQQQWRDYWQRNLPDLMNRRRKELVDHGDESVGVCSGKEADLPETGKAWVSRLARFVAMPRRERLSQGPPSWQSRRRTAKTSNMIHYGSGRYNIDSARHHN